MKRSRIASALAGTAVCALACALLWPHARDAGRVLAAQDDPAELSDLQLNSALRNNPAVVAQNMSAGGGRPQFVVVTTGVRAALSDVLPGDSKVRAGDLVRFDVGCSYEGYASDIARTAVVGPPTTLQRDRYGALEAGEAAQLAALRPGVTAGELFDIAVRTVEEHGLRPYRRHHCGHAIGMAGYETPVISPGVGTVVESGDVYCLETPFYELGWGGMMIEDTVSVSEHANDVFTTLRRELHEVAA